MVKDVAVDPLLADLSPDSGSPPGADDGAASKSRSSLACTHCRRQKLRCDVADKLMKETGGDAICTRCKRLGKDCVAIRGMRGRKLGSKNKPKPPKDATASSSAAPLPPPAAAAAPVFAPVPVPSMPPLQMPPLFPHKSFDAAAAAAPPLATPNEPPEPINPLGLLAEASHTLPGVDLPAQARLSIGPMTPQLGLRISRHTLNDGLQLVLGASDVNVRSRPASQHGDTYFATRASGEGKRDLGPALDPVDLHLLEWADAERLFRCYFETGNLCGPILDADLHTPAYCRARSALLFSAVALVAAQTLPGDASITHRLRRHVAFLRQEVYVRNYRSLEIMQAFDVLSLWPVVGEHVDEDRSNLAIAHSCAIAFGLGLDKMGRNTSTPGDLSAFEQREKRARERALIALYVFDRTFAAATGSTWMLPDDNALFTFDLETWDRHPLAAIGDAKLLHHALLRRATSAIQVALRRELAVGGDPARLPKLVLELYHSELGRWLRNYRQRSRAGAIPATLDANMMLLYHTSAVWTLASALPYVTNDDAGQNLLHALQHAALEACEVLVLSAEAFMHAPFNLSVLILYSALMALKLHQINGAADALPPLLGLLGQGARWLEVSGSTPPHRSSASTLYGQQLMQILRAAATASPSVAATVGGGAGSPNAAHKTARPTWNDAVAPTLAPGVGAPDFDGLDGFLSLDWLSGAYPSDVADAFVSYFPAGDLFAS